MGFEVETSENLVSSEEKDTTGHGTSVMEYLGNCASEASFSFYRALVEDPESKKGVAKRGNIIKAIMRACEDGVDILNLSLGVCHSEEEGHDCGGLCRIADEARLAVEEDDLIIVAAAGNSSNAEAVTCPALVREVIGVGGYLSRCENEIDKEGNSSQYWAEEDEVYGPFCGYRGCIGASCQNYRCEQPWEGNASFHNAVPDILAPANRIGSTGDGIIIEAGTSFATPIIAGRLAAVLSDLYRSQDTIPAAEEISRVLRLTGVELDRDSLTRYDERNFLQYFLDQSS